MSNKKAKTFEEKINAILRYEEYTQGGWKNKARFLPKFAYLAEDELEKLLQLGQEIDDYAAGVAKSLYRFSEVPTAEDHWKLETLAAAIHTKYPYLDAVRVMRLAASSGFNAVR